MKEKAILLAIACSLLSACGRLDSGTVVITNASSGEQALAQAKVICAKSGMVPRARPPREDAYMFDNQFHGGQNSFASHSFNCVPPNR